MDVNSKRLKAAAANLDDSTIALSPSLVSLRKQFDEAIKASETWEAMLYEARANLAASDILAYLKHQKSRST